MFPLNEPAQFVVIRIWLNFYRLKNIIKHVKAFNFKRYMFGQYLFGWRFVVCALKRGVVRVSGYCFIRSVKKTNKQPHNKNTDKQTRAGIKYLVRYTLRIYGGWKLEATDSSKTALRNRLTWTSVCVCLFRDLVWRSLWLSMSTYRI